jgi:basic membrane lipoprotein Med (substrate-binding protein (PBP1-ABC) superfamily)
MMNIQKLIQSDEISLIARLSGILALALGGVLLLLLGLQTGAPVMANAAAVGLVTDENGVADMSWNWLIYQGLLRAEAELGVVGTVYTTTDAADYEPQLQQCAVDGNDLCLAVGWLMSPAIVSAASANPATKFAIVDGSCSQPFCDIYPSNLRALHFVEEEAGYLAGTLAGHMTQSDVIGAVATMKNVPAVRLYADGYRNGAQCSNSKVDVLIEYTGTWSDPELGAEVAQNMIAQGADAIFAIGGTTGVGAVLTATQSGAWGIGVDTDWYLSFFQNGGVTGSDKLLSSAMKRMDNGVFGTISDVISGTFTSGEVLYNLAAEGIGLAPFHEADPLVSQGVRDALDIVKQGIVSGTIAISDPCRPNLYLPVIEK